MSKKRKIVCYLSGFIFIFILLCIVLNHSLYIDTTLVNLIYKSRNDFFTMIFKFFTFLGSAKFIIIVSLLILCYLFFYKKSIKVSLFFGFNLVNIIVLNQVIKFLVRRPRPLDQLIVETGYSFPSAHSMVALGFYGMLIFLLNKSHLKKEFKKLLTIILILLIILIGLSRIYLGVHYPSDVLAGYCITSLYLIIYVTYIKVLD